MTLPSGTKCYHCFVLKSVPARSRPVRRDGRSSGGRGDASPHRCGVAEDSSVVDGAEREEVGDAVEVLEAADALAALARRRRLIRLHLFLPSELAVAVVTRKCNKSVPHFADMPFLTVKMRGETETCIRASSKHQAGLDLQMSVSYVSESEIQNAFGKVARAPRCENTQLFQTLSET